MSVHHTWIQTISIWWMNQFRVNWHFHCFIENGELNECLLYLRRLCTSISLLLLVCVIVQFGCMLIVLCVACWRTLLCLPVLMMHSLPLCSTWQQPHDSARYDLSALFLFFFYVNCERNALSLVFFFVTWWKMGFIKCLIICLYHCKFSCC